MAAPQGAGGSPGGRETLPKLLASGQWPEQAVSGAGPGLGLSWPLPRPPSRPLPQFRGVLRGSLEDGGWGTWRPPQGWAGTAAVLPELVFAVTDLTSQLLGQGTAAAASSCVGNRGALVRPRPSPAWWAPATPRRLCRGPEGTRPETGRSVTQGPAGRGGASAPSLLRHPGHGPQPCWPWALPTPGRAAPGRRPCATADSANAQRHSWRGRPDSPAPGGTHVEPGATSEHAGNAGPLATCPT